MIMEISIAIWLFAAWSCAETGSVFGTLMFVALAIYHAVPL